MTAFDLLSVLLLEGSIQAGLTGLVIVACTLLVRWRDARFAHGLLAIALLKFAIPPVFPFRLGVFTGVPVRFHVESPSGDPSTWFRLAVGVYLAGVVLVASRRVAELLTLQRLVARARRPATTSLHAFASVSGLHPAGATPRLLVSTDVAVPCAFGFFRPVIVIPEAVEERLTEEQMRAVLIHELCHLRRRDPVWNALYALSGVVWWFHPVFHLVDRLAREIREECCDEIVVREAGIHPREYAQAIVAVASGQGASSPLFASAAASRKHPLVRRIRSIARLTERGSRVSRRLGAAALIVAAVVVLPGIDLQASREPDRVIFVHGDRHHHDHRH